jgi:1-acyl-sn-glycerol-3-phosphate acyltransferase
MMLLRWILKRWIRAALWFRYREIRIVAQAPIPMDQGIIVTGNHRNSLLDSMTMAVLCPKEPYTLSRASTFDKRFARPFLRTIQMLPIYRFRDGFGKMRRNAEAFGDFTRVLSDDNWVLIFPEGSHYLKHVLRRFQKGFARIAFAAQEAQGWTKELSILPFGMQYDSLTTFGSRLLIQFGPPVSTLAYRGTYLENPKEAERDLTRDVHDAVERLLVVLPEDDEGYSRGLERWNRTRGRYSDLMEQFNADRRSVTEGDSVTDLCAGEEVGKGPLRKIAAYLLAVLGVALHLPVILPTLALEWAIVRDPNLAPSLRFVYGMLLVPIWYLTAGAAMVLFLQSLPLGLALVLILPVSLWAWSRTWHWAGAPS